MTIANGKGPGPNVHRTMREDRQAGRGGMACPECAQTIEISLDDLLVRRSFTCRTPGCGIVLRLDQRRSTEAIETLRQLKTKLRKLGSES